MTRAYRPDRWVLVDLTVDGECTRHVLAGWSGGYLDPDQWRRSSAVGEPERIGDELHFHTASGALYRCGVHQYGLTGLTGSVLARWQRDAQEQGYLVEVVPEPLGGSRDEIRA